MKTNTLIKTLRESQHVQVALWLVKDACWVMGFHLAAMFMIVPTFAVALYAAWNAKKGTTQLFYNVAICYWVAANAMWMTGQFFDTAAFVPYSAALFVAGMAVVASYFVLVLPRKKAVQQTSAVIYRTMMAEVKKVA